MGNPDMAAAGTISVTVGGDEADFQAARPILKYLPAERITLAKPAAATL